LCCGTGCIGISIYKNTNNIKDITFNDNFLPAIECTKINLNNYHLQGKIIHDDFHNLFGKKQKYDVIVMNPPYVTLDEFDVTMSKYEHAESFIDHKDGFSYYRFLLDNYQQLVNDKNNFLIGLEFSYNQKQQMIEYLKKVHLYEFSSFYQDYAKHDRVVIINVLK